MTLPSLLLSFDLKWKLFNSNKVSKRDLNVGRMLGLRLVYSCRLTKKRALFRRMEIWYTWREKLWLCSSGCWLNYTRNRLKEFQERNWIHTVLHFDQNNFSTITIYVLISVLTFLNWRVISDYQCFTSFPLWWLGTKMNLKCGAW